MTNVNVLVVGGGPGGCSAAYHLARGGASVALVDSREAGGSRPLSAFSSALAQDCLAGMDLTPWAEGFPRCREMLFVGPRGTSASWVPQSHQRSSLDIPRDQLEQELLQAAASVGVQLYLDTRVRGVEVSSRSVSVEADGETVPAADLLILAEGARPRLAASLGLVRHGIDYVGLHAGFESDCLETEELHYLPDLLPSVARVVPAGPGVVMVCVSALASHVRGSMLMSGFRQLVQGRALHGSLSGSRPIHSPRVRYLRSGLHSVTPFGERVLLAGEAAGVVHPLTQEGIGAAMESGRVAAQHSLYALEKGRFAATDLSAYSKALRRVFGVEYRSARFLRELLRSERVLERIMGRAQRDPNFVALIGQLFTSNQSTLGTLTPANLLRYLMWWRTPRRRR